MKPIHLLLLAAVGAGGYFLFKGQAKPTLTIDTIANPDGTWSYAIMGENGVLVRPPGPGEVFATEEAAITAAKNWIAQNPNG